MKHTQRNGFLAFMVVALLGSGCHHEEHHEEGLPAFEVMSPIRQTAEITREYVCQIHAIQHIEIRALEGGYLQKIYIDEGQSVTRGQRLFQITPVLYQAEVARSAAEAQFAEVEFQNTQILREGNVVSENELALARANLNKATATRQLAEAHLGFASIEAPFDGIVGRLHVRQGSLLEEGELLTVLSDNSKMWVYFNVSEAEYLTYKRSKAAGEPVNVRLRMADGEIFDEPGVIQTIEADFNHETGTIAFRAGFENPDQLLRHGETGEILMSTPIENALLIPQKATYEILDKTFVYVVDDENVVHAREIHVGEQLPHLYVVADGLEESDRVLLEGLRRVRDGDEIEPASQNPEKVLAELDLPAE